MTLPTGNKRNAERTAGAAFTLIELILVMAMLMIVLAVSAPSLSKFFHGRTLEAEARRFVSLTRYAQSRAIADGSPMIVWIDAKQGWYGLQQETPDTDPDPKAVTVQVARDLSLELADLPATSGRSSQERITGPRIRMTADGFISETSPASVVIREQDQAGDAILITLSRNRLNYEIATNLSQNLRR